MINAPCGIMHRDLSFMKRHIMRSIAKNEQFTLLTHSFGNLLTFSLVTNSGEESYPYFFSSEEKMFNEATEFLKQYNLKIEQADAKQKKYKIC